MRRKQQTKPKPLKVINVADNLAYPADRAALAKEVNSANDLSTSDQHRLEVGARVPVYTEDALRSFLKDYPSSDFQRGYLTALIMYGDEFGVMDQRTLEAAKQLT
jgi:hypothetical protein